MSVQIECAQCAVLFWVTDRFDGNKRQDHSTFYCPNGHKNHYPSPRVTPEQKQITELEQTIERRARSYRSLADSFEEWKAALRTCPICEEKVTRAQYPETIRAKVAEHLRDEHGAKARLRAITEKASEAS